ncbi:MAG TPA: mechanosensitive ion channel domain-containing protein [Oligoflexus sp.]|uniref:mechanosensitive ion channel family protein n=1 Tax=Oligoflexus sp. TaxID=1971216 RepID=UPI002D5347DC|nr:mechanosensitive ion channel domain-containing protein [Oligoflexus sp.]HYX34680.1 mechanosensitive ion channel domain-containing protein [Oligoflexus sp.]
MKSFSGIISYFSHPLFTISDTKVTIISLIIFLMICIASVVLGRLARTFVFRITLQKGTEAQRGLAYSLGNITQYAVTIAGILIALDNIGISLTALAALGAILTVGIGFGLQNIAQNFISGIIVLIERPVQKGDYIKIDGTIGLIDAISMRATRILTRDNVALIVPNSKLISETVINLTAPMGTYRVQVAVNVAYGSDVTLVRDVLMEVALSHPPVLKTPLPQVFFRDFAESALAFELAAWLPDPGPAPVVASDLRFAIDAAFRKHKIQIPFPQRDLHIRHEAQI